MDRQGELERGMPSVFRYGGTYNLEPSFTNRPSDGGGIRGYHSLLVLRHLMNTIRSIEESFSNWEDEVSSAASSFNPPEVHEDEQHGIRRSY